MTNHQDFNSYLARIKSSLQNKGAYIMFLEGDYGLGNPPFFCDFDKSVKGSVFSNNITGFETLIIYKSAHRNIATGVYLENVTKTLLSNIKSSNTFYDEHIQSIEKCSKNENSYYIKFVD